ncbi:uncharacterized protein LOC143557185 [Bidens hawaiensis]|uniref:uncharacterized protein LOC143557185 n=1 Tax=Bidens hawaiensis TaxID=980011 RepID=UPI00404B40E3
MVSSASFAPTWHTCFLTTPCTAIIGGRGSKYTCNNVLHASPPPPLILQKKSWFDKSNIIPLAASMTLLLSTYPAQAGILSGFPGIESVPGPELPKLDSLSRFNEENQKRYAENDARFKESPLLKELLEKSKLNKEKNRQSIQDKYCIRGAEWGVGDCSTEGMTQLERDEFIAALKKKAGVE